MCHENTGDGPLYTCVEISLKIREVIYHINYLECIYDSFNVIFIEKTLLFFENKDIFKWPQTFER